MSRDSESRLPALIPSSVTLGEIITSSCLSFLTSKVKVKLVLPGGVIVRSKGIHTGKNLVGSLAAIDWRLPIPLC